MDILSSISDLGSAGIVTVAVLMMFTGRLFPRRSLDDCVADKEKWQKLALSAAQQNAVLLEAARIAAAISTSSTLPSSNGQVTK